MAYAPSALQAIDSCPRLTRQGAAKNAGGWFLAVVVISGRLVLLPSLNVCHPLVYFYTK
jgi:hypothetical protein